MTLSRNLFHRTNLHRRHNTQATYVNNDDEDFTSDFPGQDIPVLSPVPVPPDMVVSSISPNLGGEIPAFTNWPGEHDFNVSFDQQFEKPTKNTTWTYSEELDKLYVITQKACPFKFTTGKHPPEGSIIRALPIYSRAEHMADIVQRCPNHSFPAEISNIDQVAPPSHLVRCDFSTAEYQKGANGRLSVIVPYELPQAGTNYSTYLYKFMCYSSCVGGLNRRPIQLIFTLENNGEVLGRRSVKVRICACPGRDRKSDEKRKQGRSISRQASFTKPSSSTSGKRKALPMDELYTVQIRGKENYEMVLKIVEALELKSMISSEQIEAYRTERSRLNDGGNRSLVVKGEHRRTYAMTKKQKGLESSD